MHDDLRHHAWVFVPGLLVLTLSFLFDFSRAWSLTLALGYFLPLAAGWLGLNYGKRGLVPVLIGFPILASNGWWLVTETMSIRFGSGVTGWLLSIIVLLAFADPDRIKNPARLPLARVAGLGVLIAGATPFVNLNFEWELLQLQYIVSPVTLLMVLSFAALLFYRVSLPALLMLAGGLLAATLLRDQLVPLMKLSADWERSFDGELDLRHRPSANLIFYAVAGGAAGFLLRSLMAASASTGVPENLRRTAGLMMAGLVLASIPPVWWPELLGWLQTSAEAAETELPSITVTAEPRISSRFSLLSFDGSLIYALGLGAFALGFRRGRRGVLMAALMVAGFYYLNYALGSVVFYKPGAALTLVEDSLKVAMLAVGPVMVMVIHALAGWRRSYAASLTSRALLPGFNKDERGVVDVTALSRNARRLDINAIWRAFLFVATVAIALAYTADLTRQLIPLWAAGPGDFDDWDLLLVPTVLALGVLFIPAGFVVQDLLSRKNLWLLSGLLAVLAALFIIGFVGFPLWSAYQASWTWESAAAPETGLWIAGFTVGLWLACRQFLVEKSLATSLRRSIILGRIAGGGLFRRLAYLTGLPSSHWTLRALSWPSLWAFMLARPVFYIAFFPFMVLFIAVRTGDVPASTTELDAGIHLATQGINAAAMATGFNATALSLLFILMALTMGRGLFFLAKRLAARQIWSDDALSSPDQTPTLFLRSFENDQFDFRRPRREFVARWIDLWAFRANADEVLVDEFAQYGPIVAFGVPGEKRAPYGAKRRYFPHDDWQRAIREISSRAGAIVMSAGLTPGIVFEYGVIRDQKLLDKTLFIFPVAGPDTGDPMVLFAEAFPEFTAPDLGPNQQVIAVDFMAESPRIFITSRARAQSWLVVLRIFYNELRRT